MNSAEHSIDLRILEIKPQPTTVNYQSEVIFLFITGKQGVAMPMGSRSIPLPPHSTYLFYDQNRSFDLNFTADGTAKLGVIRLNIDTLHHIIADGTDELDFAQSAIFEKEQYHHFEPASIDIQNVLQQLIDNDGSILYRESKKYEILDLYFNSRSVQTYKCPFLNQKDNVNKVREAKQQLISDLRNTITIKELARRVGLNEYNLKTGFKEIYGKPIHGFLKDYKMMHAKELIETKDYQINEVADMIGYSNVSHFIEAFKRKFGQTPKQFELSL